MLRVTIFHACFNCVQNFILCSPFVIHFIVVSLIVERDRILYNGREKDKFKMYK